MIVSANLDEYECSVFEAEAISNIGIFEFCRMLGPRVAADLRLRCLMISLHGRHSDKPTAPLGQCTRGMSPQAVGTAPVRSCAILNSLSAHHLHTTLEAGICCSPVCGVVAVNGEIAAWAP